MSNMVTLIHVVISKPKRAKIVTTTEEHFKAAPDTLQLAVQSVANVHKYHVLLYPST